jgi:hypothetical protein
MGARIWTDERNTILVQGYEAERKTGYQAESGWKKASHERIARYVTEHANFHCLYSQAQDRFSVVSSSPFYSVHCAHILQLKKDWKAIQTLRGLSGFGWDNELSQVTATPGVWDAYNEV